LVRERSFSPCAKMASIEISKLQKPGKNNVYIPSFIIYCNSEFIILFFKLSYIDKIVISSRFFQNK